MAIIRHQLEPVYPSNMASIYCLMADKIWNIYQAVPVCCWYWRVEETEIIHMNTMVDLQQVEKAL